MPTIVYNINNDIDLKNLPVYLQTNDYTSYRGDTVGRRSTLSPYTHMSKYSSYATDHQSLSSHYGGAGGYNGWGLWRDTGNLSPAMSVTKKRSLKSFSIILMTAAFIVVLAVLSVAGLAFYFSTFRSDLDDCKLRAGFARLSH